MRRFCYLIIILSLFVFCGPKQQKVERTSEDGVEVVINHIEPYQIGGEPTSISLEKVFTIDTERNDIVEIGLTDIGAYFDVDSKDNIYLVSPKNDENIIFKFDRQGKFISSFCRKGRGPGEIQTSGVPSLHLHINSEDEIIITDSMNKKLVFFESEGSLIKEIKLVSDFISIIPLENGNYLGWKRILDAASDFLIQNPLILYGSEFEEIKELDRQKIPNPMKGKRLKGTWHVFSWSLSKESIFTGFQERGYEIYVFGLEGELIRKIRKEYKQIPIPKEHKNRFMEIFKNPVFNDIRSKIYFPDSMPPFHSFFTDDEGRLFIMTYEKGENQKEYLYDVYNSEGVFITRLNLRAFHDESGLYVRLKKGRLYCLNEKDSGYKKLVVYIMRWE